MVTAPPRPPEDPRVRDLIKASLVDLVPPDMRPDAEALPLLTLLHRVSTWFYRGVYPAPRRVHVAPELASDTGAAPEVVEEIISRLREGKDVTRFLSNQAQRPHLKPTRDKNPDSALAVWGIHHLHTSLDVRPDGLAERTGALLFIHVMPKDVLVVGVFDHDLWAPDGVARRCIRNWPETVFHEMPGVVGLDQYATEDERSPAHRKGVNVIFELDGKVYMGGMQSSIGSPMSVTEEVNGVTHDLWEWDRILIDEAEKYSGRTAELRGTDFGLTDGTTFEPVTQVRIGREWIGAEADP